MQSNEKIGLFTEDYRPNTLEGYIGNPEIISKVKEYIKDGNKPPHLLLHGVAGTGKTTLAKIIANVTNSDVKYINASDENGIEAIRVKVKNFASKASFSDFKLIILDEADGITPQGQKALRNVMEEYASSTRFILTCNYVEKIINAVQSRCVTYHVEPPSKKEVAKRLVHICKEENIKFNLEDLKVILDRTYPDIRRALNELQTQSISGELVLDTNSQAEAHYEAKIIEILASKKDPKKKYQECRQVIANSRRRSFEGLYRTLFDRVDEYVEEGGRAQAILNIAEAMNDDAFAVDKEINVVALIIKLLM